MDTGYQDNEVVLEQLSRTELLSLVKQMIQIHPDLAQLIETVSPIDSEPRRAPFDPVLMRQGDFHYDSGYRETEVLLSLSEPPTAIVASCDMQAAGIYCALHEHRLRVPEDMSVIGYDDIPSAKWMSPALTTIHQPLRKMGSMAIELLLQQLVGETLSSSRVELVTSLVIRQSCAPPRHE